MLNNRGFTLVELLIGVTILTVSLFSLLTLHAQSFKLSAITRAKTIALNAAHQEMERIRNLPYDDPLSTDDVFGQNGITFQAPPLIGNNGLDPGATIITDDPDYPLDLNIRQIIVSVAWAASGNRPPGAIQITTKRCRY